jgi:hypothetical protein
VPSLGRIRRPPDMRQKCAAKLVIEASFALTPPRSISAGSAHEVTRRAGRAEHSTRDADALILRFRAYVEQVLAPPLEPADIVVMDKSQDLLPPGTYMPCARAAG